MNLLQNQSFKMAKQMFINIKIEKHKNLLYIKIQDKLQFIERNSAVLNFIIYNLMGQSQSPPKLSAKPSSSLFQNNLALKIKDQEFKKHISSHGFVRNSNLHNFKGSNLTKSSNSENNQTNNSNLKNKKQSDIKQKQKNIVNTAINGQNMQNFQLSDIKQSQAEYEDEEIRKNLNKTNEIKSNNRAYSYKFGNSIKNSQPSSDKNSAKLEENNIKLQTNKINIQLKQQQKQLKANKSSKQLSHFISQNQNSNQILFLESKNVPSSHQTPSHVSSAALKSNPSYKEFKSSYVQYKANIGTLSYLLNYQQITVKQNQNKNSHLQRKQNFQIQQNPKENKKVSQSTRQMKLSKRQKKDNLIQINKKSQDRYFHKGNKQYNSDKNYQATILINKKLNDQKFIKKDKNSNQQIQECQNKTIQKINKCHLNNNNQKYQNQITIRTNRLRKSSKNLQQSGKNSEDLFSSNKKVYASQVQQSFLYCPKSMTKQINSKQQNHHINKVINSKSFESDLRRQEHDINDYLTEKRHYIFNQNVDSPSYIQKQVNRMFNDSRLSDQSQQRQRVERKSVKYRSKLRESTYKKILRRSATQQSIIQQTKQHFKQLPLDSLDRKLDKLNSSELSISSKLRQNQQQNNRSSSIINENQILQLQKPQDRSFIKSKGSSHLKIKQKIINYKKPSILHKQYIQQMSTYQIQINRTHTQQNYFNQNHNRNEFTQTNANYNKLEKNRNKLKDKINNLNSKHSQYDIKIIDNKNKLAKNTDSIQRKKQSLNNKERLSSTRKLYVFTNEIKYSLKQNPFQNKSLNVMKVQEKSNNNNIKQKQTNFHNYIKDKQQRQSSIKICQKQSQGKGFQNHINKSKSKPKQLSSNYLQKGIQKNHLFAQYSNKNNSQPSDKKTHKFIKFSQLEPNILEIMANQKLIQTTSAKNYAYDDQGTKKSVNPIQNVKNQYIQKIQKVINDGVGNDFQKTSKQHKKNKDYQLFLQELQNLERIKQIQKNLISENIDINKKFNKNSIFDLNKDLINQQITLKIQRMNKLKQLSKLNKKLDPALLVKSKSNQFLQHQYKKTKQENKKSHNKNKKHTQTTQSSLQKYQKLVDTQAYYSTSKQLNDLSYLKNQNKLNNSNLIKSSQELFRKSIYKAEHIENSIAKQKKLNSTLKKSKDKKVVYGQLTSIPESPQIKFIAEQYVKNRQSIIKLKQFQKSNSQLSKTMKSLAYSLDHSTLPRKRQSTATISLQKSISPKKALIVF